MKPNFGIMVTDWNCPERNFFGRGLTTAGICGKFAPEKGCDEDMRGESDPQREAGW